MNDDQDKIENMDTDMEVVPDEDGALPDLQARIKKLKADLARCEKERHEYLDGWQRAKADMINYKKEDGRRMEDLMRFASAALMRELLPVLDALDLAIESAGAAAPAPAPDHGKLEQGIRIIRSQLTDILKKQGIMEIDVGLGEQFNPEKHESIGEIETHEYAAGSIAEIAQRGYELAGRVIRPARVRLAKEAGDLNKT